MRFVADVSEVKTWIQIKRACWSRNQDIDSDQEASSNWVVIGEVAWQLCCGMVFCNTWLRSLGWYLAFPVKHSCYDLHWCIGFRYVDTTCECMHETFHRRCITRALFVHFYLSLLFFALRWPLPSHPVPSLNLSMEEYRQCIYMRVSCKRLPPLKFSWVYLHFADLA